MPYRVDGYTKYIYPLKLHEYLASGRPAVGAPIDTLREFADVVSLASSLDEWSDAVGRNLLPSATAPKRREARQLVARKHDWEILTLKVARAVARRLGDDVAERLAAAIAGRDS